MDKHEFIYSCLFFCLQKGKPHIPKYVGLSKMNISYQYAQSTGPETTILDYQWS